VSPRRAGCGTNMRTLSILCDSFRDEANAGSRPDGGGGKRTVLPVFSAQYDFAYPGPCEAPARSPAIPCFLWMHFAWPVKIDAPCRSDRTLAPRRRGLPRAGVDAATSGPALPAGGGGSQCAEWWWTALQIPT
jgi:hypothetical protein